MFHQIPLFLFIVKKPFGGAILSKFVAFHTKYIVWCCRKSLIYLSETLLFPTAAVPADPADLADPADPPHPPDPSKMVPEPALRPSLPHAPGVRMT